MHEPTKTIRLANAASRRAMIGRIVRFSGLGWQVGAGAGLVLVLTRALLADAVAWAGAISPAWLVGVPVVLGIAAGLIAAFLGRDSLLAAAGRIDAAQGLKDRFSSAIALSKSRGTDPAFVELAIAEAEARAGSVDVREAVPVHVPLRAWAGPILTLVAASTALLVPTIAWPTSASAGATELSESRAAAAAQVHAAAEVIKESLGQEATPEQIAALEEIERELREGAADADEARAETARVLEQAARELETRAAEREAAAEALRERLARSETIDPDSFESPPVRDLARAIRESDAEKVSESAHDIERELGTLGEQDRDRIARELERLAEQLEQSSREREEEEKEATRSVSPEDVSQEPPDEPEPQPSEQLRETPQAQQEEPQQPSTKNESEQQGPAEKPQPDEHTKDQPGDQGQDRGQPEPGPQDQQERGPSDGREEGSQQETREISERLREAAREAREGSTQEQQPAGREDPGDQSSENQPRPGQDGAKEDQTPPEHEGQPGEQRGPKPDQGESKKPDPASGAEPEQGGEHKKDDGQDQPRRGQEPQKQTGRGQDPTEKPSGLSGLRERFERARERERRSGADRERARRLREKADEMLQDRSGEQRESLRRWAREDQPGADPWAGKTEPADMSGPITSGRVVGQMKGAPDHPRPISERTVGQDVQRAREGLQRSLEQQVVPKRYEDYLRRVFERYAERAGGS